MERPIRNSTPPMSDEDARQIMSRIVDLGSALSIVKTQRLIVRKLSDKLRRVSLIFEITIAIIGSLSGIVGAVISPLHFHIPESVTSVLFILAGLASACTVGLPKLIDFVKQFSGRSYWEECQRWNDVVIKFRDPDNLGDVQVICLTMFAFLRPEKELRDNEAKRQELKAVTHFLSAMQCAQNMTQFVEAFNIVIPLFRVVSTSQFVSSNKLA